MRRYLTQTGRYHVYMAQLPLPQLGQAMSELIWSELPWWFRRLYSRHAVSIGAFYGSKDTCASRPAIAYRLRMPLKLVMDVIQPWYTTYCYPWDASPVVGYTNELVLSIEQVDREYGTVRVAADYADVDCHKRIAADILRTCPIYIDNGLPKIRTLCLQNRSP